MIFSRIAAGVFQSTRRKHEKAAVEPRVEQPAQIGVDGGERGIVERRGEQVAAHGDDLCGGARREVEAAEELEPRAVERLLQARSVTSEGSSR